MHQLHIETWCQESWKRFSLNTVGVIVYVYTKALQNKLFDQKQEKWLVKSNQCQKNTCGEHAEARDVVNGGDSFLPSVLTLFKVNGVEKMVITRWELNGPDNDEQDYVVGMFLLEKSPDFNTYSRSIKSSQAKNHRVQSKKNVNRQTHGQNKVASLLIVTKGRIIVKVVVSIKMLIFELPQILIKPNK